MSAQDTTADETSSTQIISIRVPTDLIEEIDQQADEMGQGWTRSDLIRLGIIQINNDQSPLVSGLCESTQEVDSQ